MSISLSSRQRGMTLIELIVFIVVVSVGLAGVLSVFNIAVRSSADPLITKQALAVADSLLEEILLKDFCDPTPAVASTANLTSGSPGLTTVSPISGVAAGWRAAGYGVPAGATVSAVDAAAQTVTLSASASQTVSAGAVRFLPCTPSVEATRAEFDDVRDYHDGTWRDAVDISGATVFSPAGLYQTQAAVSALALGGVAAEDVLKVVVSVKAPDGQVHVLTGYRYNYD